MHLIVFQSNNSTNQIDFRLALLSSIIIIQEKLHKSIY